MGILKSFRDYFWKVAKSESGQIGPAIASAAAAFGAGQANRALAPRQNIPGARFSPVGPSKIRTETGTTAFPTLASRATQGALGQDPSFGGFGPDFLSRATNPVVQARLARLREEEVPDIASAASARGLGRSTLATGQIARAGTQASRDIDQLLANFFVLNERQRKTDITQGLNVGIGQQQFERGVNLDLTQADLTERGFQTDVGAKNIQQGLLAQAGGARGVSDIFGDIQQGQQNQELNKILKEIFASRGQTPGTANIQGLSEFDLNEQIRQQQKRPINFP